MSDAPQGPGWWQASDFKWYPPQPGAPAQPPSFATPPPGSFGPQRAEPTAIGSLVCGIIGVLFFPVALVAVILGHVARGRIRRATDLSGGGMAIAGLVLGYVVMLIAVLSFVAGIVVFAVGANKSDSDVTACRTELRTLKTAAEAYRAETGSYPTSQGALVGNYLRSPSENYDFTSDGTTVTYRSTGTGCPEP